MAKLIHTSITSLDGYIADPDGNFDWSAPDEEVHAFVNDLERPIGAYLYGRRLYEVMSYWENPPTTDSAVEQDYAGIWQSADKIVYSRTLESVSTAKTRIERDFDPAAVRRLVADAETDLSVGGAHLAGEALKAGLVDEVQLFLSPVVIGGGNPSLPDGLRLELELVDERRFANGVIYLRYRVAH